MEPWLRATIPQDFEAILAIEQKAFPNPWPAEAFTDFLLPGGWTLLLDSQVIGYIFYYGGMITPLTDPDHIDDESVIINFAIDPAYHHRGWGEKLLVETMQFMRDVGVTRFFLDVRPSNISARRLYEKHGFIALGTRKNYYSQPNEDAIVMGKMFL